MEKAFLVERTDDQARRQENRPRHGHDTELSHELRFEGCTAAFNVVDRLFVFITGTADIMVADIEKWIIRNLFLEKVHQLLTVEGQKLNGQALDLHQFSFLFKFKR